MAGALMTMPMLIINMGAEMIYVLDQRLKAQNIPRDKSSKVLEDIIKTMYNENFMNELFKPHHMYSNFSTRQIFDRLAHSSIMRLNPNSMDKLYDLMRMGFKFQLLSCASADELVQVTMNHMESTKSLIDSEDVKQIIDQTILLTSQSFGQMSAADFYSLKQYLCFFFQDVRIKVSLFLQNGIQAVDGTLSIRYDGHTATGGQVPGIIRYFDENGNIDEEDMFAIDSALDATPAPEASILERDSKNTPLGRNMYEPEVVASLTQRGDSRHRSARDMIADAKRNGATGDRRGQKSFKATASDGLNLLADLLGSSSAKEGEEKAFRINLFPDTRRSGSKGDDDDDDGGEKEVPIIWIDAGSERKETDAVALEFSSTGMKDLKDDDDLLQLMDSTT